MRKAIMCLVASGMLFGCLWERDLEVRVFELERLEGNEVVALIEPYVYASREEGPGYFTVTENTLTVREMPENLDRIAEVLARFDTPRSTVLLNFQLVAANGYQGSDPEIASVEAELRNLLRYDGYRLVGNTVIQVLEGQGGSQTVIGEPGRWNYEIQVGLGMTRRGDDGRTITLEVNLIGWDTHILGTAVTLQDGKTMVLGTGSMGVEGAEALILIVTPTIS